VNLISTKPQPGIEIACSLTSQELVERGSDWESMFSEAEAASTLAEGYAFRFAGNPGQIARLVELIAAERACCPFFTFGLAFEPGDGSVSLQVGGPADVVRDTFGRRADALAAESDPR
jgi:hypothetical protein